MVMVAKEAARATGAMEVATWEGRAAVVGVDAACLAVRPESRWEARVEEAPAKRRAAVARVVGNS